MNFLGDRMISVTQPKTLVFGCDCAWQVADKLRDEGVRRLLLMTAPQLESVVAPLVAALVEKGFAVTVENGIASEPTVAMFERILARTRIDEVDAVVGVGGGSVLDMAKLVAALMKSKQTIQEVFGIGNLSERKTYLVCLPTTSGTGSEVSPNAILLDQADKKKKGVISPYLVPDAVFVDPMLTRSVPPPVTAATGMDALVHCIEAYANRYAHPMFDLYAIEGIRLIASNLWAACKDGSDLQARTALSLGSLYGGLCLGPVNTGAVHALAYPLGGEFNIAHGVANALLLPYVMAFNLPASPSRYADIAKAVGVAPTADDRQTALRGIDAIRRLSDQCGIPARLSALNLPSRSIKGMAASAMTVTRLLKNNPREVTFNDAVTIYREAW